MGKTWGVRRLNSAATCCTASLPRKRIRYASRRYYKRHPAKFLRRFVNSAWRVLSANGSVPSTNPASDQVHGSSSARTWSRNLPLAVTFRAHEFDALLVGVYEKKQLIFVAKVKNGFVPRIRDEIFPTLKALQTAQCPFKKLPEKKASRWGESLTAEKMEECRWVKPRLVCQVAFVEWRDAGHLRHCTFIAMRDEKKPSEVVRET